MTTYSARSCRYLHREGCASTSMGGQRAQAGRLICQQSRGLCIQPLTPHVTSVAVDVAALERLGDGVAVADGTTGRVDEPSSLLHLGDELLVEETFGALVQGTVLEVNIALVPLAPNSQW